MNAAALQTPDPAPAPAGHLLPALSTIGLAWSHEITAALADPRDALNERFELGPDGLWRSNDCVGFAPSGLTLCEALGMTLVVLWAANAGDDPVRTVHGAPGWLVTLPAVGVEHQLAARDAVGLVRALLVVRRVVWPAEPFRPRDQVAETLELHLRQIEAELRGPTPVVTLTPVVTASDLGRSWS